MHLPINPLGLIVNGYSFLRDSVSAIDYSSRRIVIHRLTCNKITISVQQLVLMVILYFCFNSSSSQVAVMNGSAEQQLAILQNADVHGEFLTFASLFCQG